MVELKTDKRALIDLRNRILVSIGAFENETRRDRILAWNYGLGVAFREHTWIAVSLEAADSVSDYPPAAYARILNGHDVPAQPISRIEAMHTYLPTLREMLAQVDGWLVEGGLS